MRAFKIILLFLSSFLLYTNVYAESNLVIESVRTTEKSSTMVVSDLSYVDMTITSKMEFHTLNDFVTYEIEIKNNSEKTYTLEKIINHLNTNYLSVESDDIGAIISKEEKKTIHIKVKYVEELINVESVVPNDSSLTLNFIDTTVIENPFTFDRFILLLIQIIMAIGIIGFSIIYFKKPIKLLLLLLLIPIYVFAQEMININFNFSQVSVYGRFLSYHIQLDDGSGNVNDYTRTYGEKVGDLPVPEKEGYTFEGWVDQNDRAVDRETVVEEDLDLTATYGLVHYTITYNLNGGELVLPNPTSYTVEDEFTLYNPIKTGYTFGGWIAEGSSTLQTEFTIYPGTTGNKTFTAFYSPNPSTVYTVIHKQMNLEGVYEEYERETLHGATESRVSPQPIEYPGFKIPELQTITILGDGSSTVTYLYERNKYTFQVNHREDIESATEDGLYYYETRVNVTAKIKLGYTLLWNDGSELYERSFLLENDTILTPSYTPIDNTPYTVIHKQMNLDGETYTVYDEETFYGTTDTMVTPLPNDYEGFTSPSAQELTITGDGEASVTYLYTRNKYLLTIENSDLVETTTPSGEYYYGTSITLTAKESENDFIKWSNGDTTKTTTFILKGNTTIYPIYSSDVALEVYDINYTGEEQTFVVPETGYYKLEVWGAQGGSITGYHGGYGGYSTGKLYLTKNDVLYVNVGGEGLGATGAGQTLEGGYNGGGKVIGAGYNHINGSGGGATHIAFSTGTIETFENKQQDLLVVAGGGGGARNQDNHWDTARWGHGGAGGGAFSSGAYSTNGTYTVSQQNTCIANQSSGSAFGKSLDVNGNSAGGGGYFAGYHGGGGYSSVCDYLGTGSGGSGYIGNTILRDKHMACYNCQTSDEVSSKTITNECYADTPQEDCSKENDGHARISYYGFDIESNVIMSWSSSANTDFHNSSIRSTITEIEFVDLNHVTIPTIDNTASWDVSANQDEGVIAWLDGTKLYIGGYGGVIANTDSSYIFRNFTNVTRIQFNQLFDTRNTTSLFQMFYGCHKLKSLDLSSLDTRKVTNMISLFDYGESTSSSQIMDLETINLSGKFSTASVVATDWMFSKCGKLTKIYVNDDISFANVSTSAGMFYNCPSLVGGIGTSFNSSFVDKTYAKVDKVGQAGYLTSINDDYLPNMRDVSLFTDYKEFTGGSTWNNIIGNNNIQITGTAIKEEDGSVTLSGNSTNNYGTVDVGTSTERTIYIIAKVLNTSTNYWNPIFTSELTTDSSYYALDVFSIDDIIASSSIHGDIRSSYSALDYAAVAIVSNTSNSKYKFYINGQYIGTETAYPNYRNNLMHLNYVKRGNSYSAGQNPISYKFLAVSKTNHSETEILQNLNWMMEKYGIQ